MAQSENSRMEKLLLHELQPEEISEVGLVYSAEIDTLVRKEKITKKMDGFISRS
jgi:hypothetical protein